MFRRTWTGLSTFVITTLLVQVAKADPTSSSTSLAMQSLTNSNGITFSYIDTGAPSTMLYTTFIAVHGVEFTSPIFAKVALAAKAAGFRFVALNRRQYNGTTPFTAAQTSVITTGTDDQKLAFLTSAGADIALFIDMLIQKQNLPAITGNTGGVGLIGWSAGATYTAAAIASVDTLPADTKVRLTAYLRAHIMQEAPSVSFGLALPPQTWSPQIDTSFPTHFQVPMFTRWITSYFDHGDLSTKDVNNLEYVLPSLKRAPSIWNMTPADCTSIIDEGPNLTFETPFMLNLFTQTNVVYKKALFAKSVKILLPFLKSTFIVGDSTANFGIAAMWSIQADDTANGGGNVNYITVPGVNHFMHWDDPAATLKAYISCCT